MDGLGGGPWPSAGMERMIVIGRPRSWPRCAGRAWDPQTAPSQRWCSARARDGSTRSTGARLLATAAAALAAFEILSAPRSCIDDGGRLKSAEPRTRTGPPAKRASGSCQARSAAGARESCPGVTTLGTVVAEFNRSSQSQRWELRLTDGFTCWDGARCQSLRSYDAG
jgi:hypothetical protein